MRTIEVKAKTREEAIQKALAELHAERHEVAVEILDEGSSGFLGLGRRDVCLRVTSEKEEPEEVRPPRAPREPRREAPRETPRESASPTSERDDSERRRGGRGGGRRGRPENRSESAPVQGESRNEPRSEPRTESRNEPRQESRSEPRTENRGERREPPRAQGRTNDRRGERPGPRPAQGPRTRDNGNRNARRDEEPREAPTPRPAIPSRPLGEGEITAASELLQEMILHMGITAKVTSHVNEEGSVVLAVESEDSAILIGRKGRTLHALQYLINRMIRTSNEETDVPERILVDIEGYIERRRASLEEMALRMAKRAKETGRRVRVKPLSPQERRIIHVTLQEDPDVRTFSVGSAASRCVIIAPKDERPRRRTGPRPDNRYAEKREGVEETAVAVEEGFDEEVDVFDDDEDNTGDDK